VLRIQIFRDRRKKSLAKKRVFRPPQIRTTFSREKNTRQISLLRTATVLLQDQRPGVLSVELRKLLLYFTIAAALKTFGDKLNAMLSSSKGDTRTANRQSEGKRGKDEHEQIERERERRERARAHEGEKVVHNTAAFERWRLRPCDLSWLRSGRMD
jgi:hypothetical protein